MGCAYRFHNTKGTCFAPLYKFDYGVTNVALSEDGVFRIIGTSKSSETEDLEERELSVPIFLPYHRG